MCNILECEDQLDVDTVMLYISGRLCPFHYHLLAKHPDIYKHLYDSRCFSLQLCEEVNSKLLLSLSFFFFLEKNLVGVENKTGMKKSFVENKMFFFFISI